MDSYYKHEIDINSADYYNNHWYNFIKLFEQHCQWVEKETYCCFSNNINKIYKRKTLNIDKIIECNYGYILIHSDSLYILIKPNINEENELIDYYKQNDININKAKLNNSTHFNIIYLKNNKCSIPIIFEFENKEYKCNYIHYILFINSKQ